MLKFQITNAIWWFYFSKCIEFCDSFFFILRKKDIQLTFLHVYHHSTMFPLWWIGVKYVPSGSSKFIRPKIRLCCKFFFLLLNIRFCRFCCSLTLVFKMCSFFASYDKFIYTRIDVLILWPFNTRTQCNQILVVEEILDYHSIGKEFCVFLQFFLSRGFLFN